MKSQPRVQEPKLPINGRHQAHPRRSFHSAANNMARRGGGPRQRVVGAAGAMAMSAFFFATCLLQVNATHIVWVAKSIFSVHRFGRQSNMNKPAQFFSSTASMLRGGHLEHQIEMSEPPL
eukprot:824752_1